MSSRPPGDPRGLRTLPPARPRGEATTIEMDGDLIRAYVGEPVAVALFAEGVRVLSRSPKYHRPRGLFCGTGHCGSCLMRIDGRPNVRACMTPASPGLRCERQNAVPDADLDLLAAADWMFPAGMDHHRLMTGTQIGNDVFVKLVRRMGGTGTLPDAPATSRPAPRDRHVTVCVVGAGPAGLSAALAVAATKSDALVLVIDDQPVAGGSLLAEPDGWARASVLCEEAVRAGVEVLSNAIAIGVYPSETEATTTGDAAPGMLTVATPQGLLRVTAERIVYATGAYDQNLPIADNDRPGTLPARALGRLAFHWGVAPAGKIVLVTPNHGEGSAASATAAYLTRLVNGLEGRGLAVSVEATPHRVARNRDVIALGATPAPASELARQHGAKVSFDLPRGGFCVSVSADGKAAPGIYCVGDVLGYLGPNEAAAAGTRTGETLARAL